MHKSEVILTENVNVLWIFMLDYTKNWGIHPHSHDFWQLYYITSGSAIMELDSRRIQLSKGTTVLIRPMQIHQLFEVQEGTLRMLDAKFQITDSNLSEKLRQIPDSVIMDNRFFSIFSQVRSEWKSDKPFGRQMANILMEQCLYTLARMFCPFEAPSALLSNVQEAIENLSGISRQIATYVQNHFSEGFSLDAIAQELNYNKNYLCKAFRRDAGFTIVYYTNYLRISLAIQKIGHTSCSISEIAEQVGFHDIHYFSKVFKSITGQTPGEMRRKQEYEMFMDVIQHGPFSYRYHNLSNSEKRYKQTGRSH